VASRETSRHHNIEIKKTQTTQKRAGLKQFIFIKTIKEVIIPKTPTLHKIGQGLTETIWNE